jgi:hypothetical protein
MGNGRSSENSKMERKRMKEFVRTILYGVLMLSAGACCGQEIEEEEPVSMGMLIDELSELAVSGEELARRVADFRESWDSYIKERRKIAEALAELAKEFEDDGQYAKALLLYERIWDEFPEQQELINEIKRERAIADVEVDLSKPETAFLGLKRSLLTYMLTADTFGITDPSTILYEPHIIERRALEDEIRKHHAWQDEIRDEAERNDEDAITPAENAKDNEDEWKKRKWEMNWPESGAKPRPDTVFDSLLEIVSVKYDSVPPLILLERLGKEIGIPIVVTSAAHDCITENTPESGISFHGKDIPVKAVLRFVLRLVDPDSELDFSARMYSILIYRKTRDDSDYTRPVTAVRQRDPWGRFPQDTNSETEPFSEGHVEILESLGMLDEYGGRVPDGWELLTGNIAIYTAPLSFLNLVDDLVSTAPSAGKYKGRTYPLLACMRAYPLPELAPFYDYYRLHPKARYQYDVQVKAQTMRMQRFLCDRSATMDLLQSQLVSCDLHSPGRYKPSLRLPGEKTCHLPLGLWHDEKKYRFLIFDSGEDRDRWLRGEDWFDIPSDIDDRDWPTEEEWQQKLKQREEEAVVEEESE